MTKHNQDGAISGLAISLVMAVLLLIGAGGFGVWAFSSRQDYKNNVDAKINNAVTAATRKESAVKDLQFAEASKKPLKTYNGPETDGSLVVNFPKTWSAYVDDTGTNNIPIEAYFAPGILPALLGGNSVFALRVEVLNQTYAQTLESFASQQQQGNITVSAYVLPNPPKTIGSKVVGQISGTATETMIVLPLRSQTIKLWTETNQYLADFNNNILPNFSFSP